MDGLIALLIIIAAINAITSSRKKKKARQREQQAAPQAPAPAAPSRIPYTREEWADYLREVKGAAPAAPAQPSVQAKPAPRREAPRPAQPQVKPVRAAEGATSTQGERPEEHAAHRRRIAQEEEALRLEHEALRDLRAANTAKLRNAVIMSEILGKPVSLRPNRFGSGH